MVLQLSLDNWIKRAAVISIALIVSTLLSIVVISHFIVGVVADPDAKMSLGLIASTAAYFPGSARAQAKLAEAYLTEAIEDEGTGYQAESAATLAVERSPWDYKLRLLLASAKEVRGDLAAAEACLQTARSLAPHDANVQWLLANLLVREGKLDKALDKFQTAIVSDPSRLPAALDLIWNVSGSDLAAVSAVAGHDPELKLGIADYLLKKSLVAEAARMFSELDRQTRLSFPESATFINTLIATGHIELARNLWLDLVDGRSKTDQPLLWNGGFESRIQKGWSQFDWNLESSDYARVAVTTGTARNGAGSLRIDLTGRDTTRLSGEIRQLILVRPGAHYRLECYVKTEDLVTPEGPKVVVTGNTSSIAIAASEPIAAGSHDWQPLMIDFVAPADSPAIMVSIRRVPKFSYDDPTRGTVWFDDFTLRER